MGSNPILSAKKKDLPIGGDPSFLGDPTEGFEPGACKKTIRGIVFPRPD